jgi:CRISPR-associated endonuclease Csn1
MNLLGLDIGSNSVGSAWVDTNSRMIVVGDGVFPAGAVIELNGTRGPPINQERRAKRSLRRVLRRRAVRKRLLKLRLMEMGLLPRDAQAFKELLEKSDPWQVRADALTRALSPHEFGRVLLHLSQRRGALGLEEEEEEETTKKASKKAEDEEEEGAETETKPTKPSDGAVKEAIVHLRREMILQFERDKGKQDRLLADPPEFLVWARSNNVTFGRFIAKIREERRHAIKNADGTNKGSTKKGNPREWRDPVRNKDGNFKFHAERGMTRFEFGLVWEIQKGFEGSLAAFLTNEFRQMLDSPVEDSTWRHQGLIFGQRRITWDLGVLGRCVLEPTDRCAPIADRHASYFRVLETVNNIKIRRGDGDYQSLTSEERARVIAMLRGPLLMPGKGEQKGQKVPKKSASVTDIREALGLPSKQSKSPKKGKKSKLGVGVAAQPQATLNIEADEERMPNTDWFHREVVHGAISESVWSAWDETRRESVNRAILKFDPTQEGHDTRLREGAINWWGLFPEQAEKLVTAWRTRPPLGKRLKMSRRAIRNISPYMEKANVDGRWPTQIEARMAFAEDGHARDCVTGQEPDDRAKARYKIGAKGLTARDRHFQKKHPLTVDGKAILDDEGKPIPMLPPAPMLSNPVVRKAIHEVRRHVLAYLRKFGKKPDRIVIELARIAEQPAKLRNAQLARNHVRNRIRAQVVETYGLQQSSMNQQREAEDRVILARQQEQVCVYCGEALIESVAAKGQDCEIDHIIPYSRCGMNGLNNKVVVHRNCNRDKGNQTQREWWGGEFDDRAKYAAARFSRVKPKPGDFFTKRDYDAKWRNFVAEGVPEAWKPSQLTDTAYAAKEVGAYLADALFGGKGLPERGGERRIFFTKGQYTHQLRKDWQLFETLTERGMKADEVRELAAKNRGDHREHAVDAVAIALTGVDGRIEDLAAHARVMGEFRGKGKEPPKRTPLDPPWGIHEEFRGQVIHLIYGKDSEGGIVVAHRPVKKKIVSHLHLDTLYGPVFDRFGNRTEERATNRISVVRLKPNHLKVPKGWDELSASLDSESLPAPEQRELRRRLVQLPDPLPGKSGIVRDRALRDRLRKCLRANGIDPDAFKSSQVQEAAEKGWLKMESGIPIRRVVLLRTNTDPVVIARKRLDIGSGRMVPDSDPRTLRLYDSQSNHHIEIREDRRGKWVGDTVRTIDAVARVRPGKRPDGSREPKRDAVDRSDNGRGKFIMSLAEGETIRMLNPDTRKYGYFVVFKIDKPHTIHFIQHFDARGASERKEVDPGNPDKTRSIPGTKREDFAKTAGDMKSLDPIKLRVGPLGDVKVLERD